MVTVVVMAVMVEVMVEGVMVVGVVIKTPLSTAIYNGQRLL
jgi:hypothetical protein